MEGYLIEGIHFLRILFYIPEFTLIPHPYVIIVLPIHIPPSLYAPHVELCVMQKSFIQLLQMHSAE